MKDLLAVLRNRNLALLFSGRIVSLVGDAIFQIALSVAIYRDSGGNSVYVGALWFLYLIPTMAFGSLGGVLSDRLGHRRATIAADLIRLFLVAVLALTLKPSTWVIAFPIVVLVASLGTVFRPGVAGLLQAVTSGEDRIAANAALMQSQALALIVGSAIGGAAAGDRTVNQLLLLDAATFGVSVLSLWLIRIPGVFDTSVQAQGPAWLQGFRVVAGRPSLVFAVSIMALPELISGAVVVWFVPFSIHTVHLGSAGIGYLYAVMNLGALLGGIAAAMISNSVRLDQLLTASVIAGGLSLAIFGVSSVGLLAMSMVLVMGFAETIEYSASATLFQQSVPQNAIGTTFGALESLYSGLMLVGTALSGIVAAEFGLTIPITLCGIATVAMAGLGWLYWMRSAHGRPNPEDLANLPAFAAVSGPVREWAVRRMHREEFPAGAVIIRQGEQGDTFYIIAQGAAEVEITGPGQSATHQLGPGDFFGEIALLRNVPRTATVRALEPLTAYVLSRADFEELEARAEEFKESLMQTAASRYAENVNSQGTLSPMRT